MQQLDADTNSREPAPIPDRPGDPQPPESNTAHPSIFLRPKWWVFFSLIAFAALAGALWILLDPDLITERQHEGIVVFVIAAHLVVWCVIDSVERGFRVSVGLALAIFFLAGIGFPIYLLKTRGPRGLWLILPAIGLLFLYSVIYTFVQSVVYSHLYGL